MKRFFVINFEDGFDLTEDLKRVRYVLEKVSGVEIRIMNDEWQAYYCACFHHTAKKLLRDSFVTPTLPKLEDVLRAPFYERIVPTMAPRFFALIGAGYHVSISTAIADVINFLHECNYPRVKEFVSYDEAVGWINRVVLTPIMMMGAYLKSDVPLIEDLDEKISVFPYESWLDQNCELPPDKRFTPENCVVAPDEKEFTLPLDLVELPSPK